jgi:hypothetical protein
MISYTVETETLGPFGGEDIDLVKDLGRRLITEQNHHWQNRPYFQYITRNLLVFVNYA